MDAREIASLAGRLCRCVQEKRVVILRYGKTSGLRRVEPHAVGVAGNGTVLMVAWQVLGSSVSDAHSGWKHFALDRIRHLEETQDHFQGSRPDFTGASTVLEDVTCELTTQRHTLHGRG